MEDLQAKIDSLQKQRDLLTKQDESILKIKIQALMDERNILAGQGEAQDQSFYRGSEGAPPKILDAMKSVKPQEGLIEQLPKQVDASAPKPEVKPAKQPNRDTASLIKIPKLSDIVLSRQKEFQITDAQMKELFKTDRMIGAPLGTTLGQFVQESSLNPKATTTESSAKGIAQVIDSTRESLQSDKKYGFNRILDPFNIDDAIAMHRAIMMENKSMFGNWRDALRAYKGGTKRGNWKKYGAEPYFQEVIKRRKEVLSK